MTKLTEKLYGAGLIALAFSLNAADVNAQTCTAAPSCESLGFDRSEEDCKNRTTLKCPFDNSKVYCPSYTETLKTYGIGDTYTVNGVAVGRVIAVTDCVDGSGGSNFYNDPEQCLGITSPNYHITNNSVSGYLYTSPESTYTCAETRAYTYSGTYRYGFVRVNNAGQTGGCLHGTIASLVVKTATRPEAIEKCEALNTGGLTWFLPSTYQGYYLSYSVDLYAQPYYNGLWAVSNGCFYNGNFFSIGTSNYQSSCQTRTGNSSTGYTYTDKEMSYYCVAIF